MEGKMQHANDNHTGIRFLSVCSGIEAASVAWHPLGWQAVAFSEIEKFPSAVLNHHYPDVPNLGDFTKIDTQTLGRVDILAGGTPCQAFSVAGLRQGLGDARGNLTLKFVELAHELANGNGLRNVVWENVVVVLSDKGNAFGCFLAGLVGADSAIEPPRRGKWARHGMVSGPKGRAAWAVKDGQFFGVAQRRRRVLVVADFGNGADPAAVLFEPESMFRDTPPSREAGKDIAPTISARTKGGGGLGTDFDLDGGLVENVAFAQNTRDEVRLMGGDGQIVGALAAQPGMKQTTYVASYTPEIARCDATREGSSQDYETTTMVAVSTLDGQDVARALSARHDGSPCADRGPNIVAFQSKASATNSMNPSEVCPTMDKGKSDGLAMFSGSSVRRLTPRECERLQGFQWLCSPDYPGAWQDAAGRWWSPDYTDIPWRGKPTSPDGPRYKALGNSWAVPKFVWLGQRIARFMPANDNQETTIAKAA